MFRIIFHSVCTLIFVVVVLTFLKEFVCIEVLFNCKSFETVKWFLFTIALCLLSGEKNWRWWIWGNLRRSGPGDERTGRSETRVSQAGQTGAQNGSGGAQEVARWEPFTQVLFMVNVYIFLLLLYLVCPKCIVLFFFSFNNS